MHCTGIWLSPSALAIHNNGTSGSVTMAADYFRGSGQRRFFVPPALISDLAGAASVLTFTGAWRNLASEFQRDESFRNRSFDDAMRQRQRNMPGYNLILPSS